MKSILEAMAFVLVVLAGIFVGIWILEDTRVWKPTSEPVYQYKIIYSHNGKDEVYYANKIFLDNPPFLKFNRQTDNKFFAITGGSIKVERSEPQQ